jgi:hypothetical protein
MSTLPATRTEAALVPTSLADLLALAEIAVKSGLLPESITTKEQAAVIMLKGREVGITTMQSFESIYVVHGRTAMDTKLLATLLRRAGHDYRIIERTEEIAVIDLYLKQDRTPEGWPARRYTMTMEEAKQAGWHLEKRRDTGKWEEKHTWKTMPARMLMYRCLSSGIRLHAPESLFGLHTLDEMQDERPERDFIDATWSEEPEPQPQDREPQDSSVEPEPEPEPEPTAPPPPAPWAQDPDKATKFVTAASEYFGLSQAEILTALDVESIDRVTLTMVQTKARIAAWIEERLTEAEVGANNDSPQPQQTSPEYSQAALP